VVCGGSGMESEFLSRAGASVICSDISLQSARRARERAARYGVAIRPIVADAERLPFGDRSVDFAYVHDGLHHLRDPFVGLKEMTRVARVGVSLSEPAASPVSAAAVRLGLGRRVEASGNVVARLHPDEVAAALVAAGHDVLQARRCAIVHGHDGGRIARAVSRPVLLDLAKLASRLVDGLVGGVGTKHNVQGVRRSEIR